MLLGSHRGLFTNVNKSSTALHLARGDFHDSGQEFLREHFAPDHRRQVVNLYLKGVNAVTFVLLLDEQVTDLESGVHASLDGYRGWLELFECLDHFLFGDLCDLFSGVTTVFESFFTCFIPSL